MKQLQLQEATRSKTADEEIHGIVKNIARKQEEILETITHQGNAIKGLQETIVNLLEAKLATTLNSLTNLYLHHLRLPKHQAAVMPGQQHKPRMNKHRRKPNR